MLINKKQHIIEYMKKIESLQNPAIKELVKLHTAKGRKELQAYSAEGLRTVATLIATGQRLQQLYVRADLLADVQALAMPEHITLVTEQVAQKISALVAPSGIVAVFDMPNKPDPAQLTDGIVLAQINDPGNMGTLIRTAAAMNKKSIIIVEGADPWGPKVVQATAGLIGAVTIFEWSWQDLLVNKGNYSLCALVVAGGKAPDDINFGKALLVVGNEAHGLPHEWQQHCDQRMTIPMPGNAESLNAAVAGSIALYLSWLKK
jgi:TrmH family RNA methyltransferase